jgi:hypothetical protein
MYTLALAAELTKVIQWFQAWYVLPEEGTVMTKHVGVQSLQ